MTIQSVTSSLSAYTTNSSQTNQTQQAQQTREPEKVEQKPAERVELKEEAPRPVTNTSGQTTGTVINVTA